MDRIRQEPKRGIADSATPTDDFVSITPSSAKTDERGYDSPPAAEPTNAANAPSDVSSTLPSTALHINASGSSPPQEPKDDLRVKGARCIVSPNIAFRTWRSFIFFAYTGRVAFAPLRSQGFVLHDDKRDPTQLLICSPKSMYRLAAIYGSEELKMQAGTDIQAKLSTQNVLDELFSKFTSRFPEIEDMELDFLLTHIQHPDVTIRLPQWIDRFARGDLRECAGTIGTLIHKLACAAVTPTSTVGAPKGPSSCPRGCPMPTIRTQWRCSTCGYVMT
ncbi:hypothetical protein L226DRAFT_531628 [Lentinus tigrinus ALCF2SS1-7]|uniref:uncharacterized protein n=1 Tax=Lentinus tigrinus ALCF2SS1-7 TaxID=1328758 RepID=UPI0011661016|nr:hypothetical protein L226DRAFT_531628 [Lentinus tigrinus ALCF2SS1-7]